MKLYNHTANIKAGLFILGVSLVIGLLAYTQRLVNNLREDNKEIVRLYAGLIANVVQEDNDQNLDFIFENIIKKVKFPLIQTDLENNIQMWKNLPEDIDTDQKIYKFMNICDKNNDPIPLDEELRKLEARRIVEALNTHEFNRTKTAESLGIGRTNLLAKCKRLEIELA